MLLLPIILCLAISAILFVIAYDVRVFMHRTEQAYDYAKETVPEYLENEKEFIYEKFLPELAGWGNQHERFAAAANQMFQITLVVTLGTIFLAMSTEVDQQPFFLLLVEAVDAALIGIYFAFFRPRKTMLYSKMDQFDAEIKVIQETAS